jgi:hypothetical protein
MLADVDREGRLLEDPGVLALQPPVEPAHRFATPLDLGLGPRIVREVVVPGADHGLHRRIHVLEHADHAVAVAVVPAPDVVAGHPDLVVAVSRRGPVPERAVALVAHVRVDAGLDVEAVRGPCLVEFVVGRARQGVVEVVAHHPGVGVQDPVDVVHVLGVQVLGGHQRHERLQRRRVAKRHLDGVEAAPRDAEHADVAGGEGPARQPVDDRLAVVQLDVRVFVGNHPPLAPARPPDVDARHEVAVIQEVGVERVVPRPRLVLPIRQVFEQDREPVPFRSARRPVQIGRQAHAVGHRDPHLGDLVGGLGGRCLTAEHDEQGEEPGESTWARGHHGGRAVVTEGGWMWRRARVGRRWSLEGVGVRGVRKVRLRREVADVQGYRGGCGCVKSGRGGGRVPSGWCGWDAGGVGGKG